MTPTHTVEDNCPSAGSTASTPMVDDHDARGRGISYGALTEDIPPGRYGMSVRTNFY